MIFRNLTMFRFPPSLDLSGIDDALRECALKPVGPLELSSRGFAPPMGQHNAAMSRQIGDAHWITVGGEDRLLPAAVVNSLLAKKLAEIEERDGRKVGGRTRRRIKDELLVELLPRAFVRPIRVDAIIDTALGVIAVDTASRSVAESVVAEVRRALGSFPALPLNAEVAPRAVLTGWVAGDPLPDGFALDDECVMRDPADSGSTVKMSRVELGSEEVGHHLEVGRQVTRLALTLDDRVSFTIDEDLALRKFKLLDGAADQLDSTEHDDIAAELDARFALMACEFRRLFVELALALRFSAAV